MWKAILVIASKQSFLTEESNIVPALREYYMRFVETYMEAAIRESTRDG